MPILDIDVVYADGDAVPTAAQFASAAGKVFGSQLGRTWVRLRTLDAQGYGENDSAAPVPGPVFVRVLHAQPPTGSALETELTALTHAIAAAVGRPPDLVHVEYAPAGAGRVAFGGKLVR